MYKNSKKLAILLKIGARGWGIWEKIMARGWGIWPKKFGPGVPNPHPCPGGGGWGGKKLKDALLLHFRPPVKNRYPTPVKKVPPPLGGDTTGPKSPSPLEDVHPPPNYNRFLVLLKNTIQKYTGNITGY